MSVGTFLAAVLPSQGHRFFLSTYGEQGKPDFRPVQRAYAPGREDRAIQFALRHSRNGANSYFATGGFMEPPLDPKTNRPKGGRTAARVQYFRCLRVDIDCGPNKPYPTKRDGLHALCNFCNTYSLPMPWTIDSGYGLHAYWAFDRDVTIAEWLSMAQRFATACVTHQFHVDATTTLDAARVLRVPETNNYKRGGVVPVRIIAEGAATDPAALMVRMPQAQVTFGAPVPSSMRASSTSELQQNIHTPYTLKGVLTQCPGMAAMLADGGARAQEPLWKAALDLIWKADDAPAVKERVARAVSIGHPGFSEAGFSQKWQQVQAQNYHPPTCGKLAGFGLPECAACPLRSRISSPLVLGYPQASAVPNTAVIQPPTPTPTPTMLMPVVSEFSVGCFHVTSDAHMEIRPGRLTNEMYFNTDKVPSMEFKTKEGEKKGKPIIDYAVLSVERLLDAMGQRSLTAITFDRGLDKPVRVEFTNSELTDVRSFHSVMLGNGLYVTRTAATTMADKFMPEFLSQLQRARAANKIAGRCGWTDDLDGFVLGASMITKRGTEHVRPGMIPEEMLAFHSHGNEAAWRRAFDIVLAGGADRQAVIALAIASPLMVFTGLDGVMLNAYSPETGIGKSTLGDAALSIWGSPDKLRKSARDTANATWRIAGVLGNMPMIIDEFTNVEGRALSDFVYTVTQGREKHRLTSDAKLQAAGSQRWCLAAITTANNSVHDKLQSFRMDAVAEATRVFDMRLSPLDVGPDELGRLKADLQGLRANYGFLGPRLVEVYLSKSPQEWRSLVMAKISKWDRAVAQSASDRFRSACAALIEVGAAIGAAMGLNFNVPKIRDVIERSWRQQLEEFEFERRKPIDFVIGYISDYAGEFATIGGSGGDALLANTPRKVRGELRGRAVDGKFKPTSVMIPSDMLREYIREKNGNYKAFQEWVRSQLHTGVVSRMGRLMYLEGQVHQHRTGAIEFSAAILNDGVLNRLTPVPSAAVPPTPARAVS